MRAGIPGQQTVIKIKRIEMNALREKLFEIIWDSVIKEAQKISKYPFGPCDALDNATYYLEPCEWTQLLSRWKARLKRLGITRTSCKNLHKIWLSAEGSMTLPGRNIPGFYSIIDPITTSARARKFCCLDLPTELGDKILFLGEFPNKSCPRIGQPQ